MGASLSKDSREKLATARNIWISTVRPDGRPHMVPVWFVHVDGKLFVCIEPESVKGKNLRADGRVALALEDGVHPVICEGEARFVDGPWPGSAVDAFRAKYDWTVTEEERYTALVEISPLKWMTW